MSDDADAGRWLQEGIDRKWCSPPVCATHDGLPNNEEEEAAFEEGYDPCIAAVRLL